MEESRIAETPQRCALRDLQSQGLSPLALPPPTGSREILLAEYRRLHRQTITEVRVEVLQIVEFLATDSRRLCADEAVTTYIPPLQRPNVITRAAEYWPVRRLPDYWRQKLVAHSRAGVVDVTGGTREIKLSASRKELTFAVLICLHCPRAGHLYIHFHAVRQRARIGGEQAHFPHVLVLQFRFAISLETLV